MIPVLNQVPIFYLTNIANQNESVQVFALSTAEAVLMDPQQRLLLKSSWEALSASGEPSVSDKKSPGLPREIMPA